MDDVYMARPPKIVIVLSVLPNWNKIVNQLINSNVITYCDVIMSDHCDVILIDFHWPDWSPFGDQIPVYHVDVHTRQCYSIFFVW